MTSRAYRPRSGPRSTGGIRATWARWVSNTYRYGPLAAVLGVWFYTANQWGTGAIGGAVLTLAIFAALLFASWRRRLAVMHRTDRSFYLPFWTHMVHLVRVWRLFCFWSRAIAGLTLTRRGVPALPPPRPLRNRDGVWWYVDGNGTFQGRLKHGAHAITSEALNTNAHALAEHLGAYEVTFKHLRRPAEARKSAIGELATAWGVVSGVSEIRVYYVDSMGRVIYLRELPTAPKGKIAFGRHADRSPAYVSADLSTFIFGMAGQGKSNILWTMLADLIRAGIPVRLYVSDPKGGMELTVLGDQVGQGTPMFSVHRYATSAKETADMIKSMHGGMVARQKAMAARKQRKHVPTVEDPLTILVCDEFLALEKEVKATSDSDLGRLLYQGRAAGYITIALAQDPTVEATGPLRTMFPQRIALRLDNPSKNVPALGINAPCHLIQERGVGYVFREGETEAQLFRAPYVNDREIEMIARGTVPDMPGDEVGGEETTLYRYYGALPVDDYPDLEGKTHLLYVGISNDFARRHAQHCAEKVFMDYVDDRLTRTEVWPSREKALAEEEKAIKTEFPVFNDQHNTDNPKARPIVKRPWTDPRRQAQIRHWGGRPTRTRPKVTAH